MARHRYGNVTHNRQSSKDPEWFRTLSSNPVSENEMRALPAVTGARRTFYKNNSRGLEPVHYSGQPSQLLVTFPGCKPLQDDPWPLNYHASGRNILYERDCTCLCPAPRPRHAVRALTITDATKPRDHSEGNIVRYAEPSGSHADIAGICSDECRRDQERRGSLPC